MLVHFSRKIPFGPNYAAVSEEQLSENVFGALYCDTTHQVDNGNREFSQKISPGENVQFGPNLSQNYATLYVMISSKDLFEMLQDDGGAQQVGKSDVSQL